MLAVEPLDLLDLIYVLVSIWIQKCGRPGACRRAKGYEVFSAVSA